MNTNPEVRITAVIPVFDDTLTMTDLLSQLAQLRPALHEILVVDSLQDPQVARLRARHGAVHVASPSGRGGRRTRWHIGLFSHSIQWAAHRDPSCSRGLHRPAVPLRYGLWRSDWRSPGNSVAGSRHGRPCRCRKNFPRGFLWCSRDTVTAAQDRRDAVRHANCPPPTRRQRYGRRRF